MCFLGYGFYPQWVYFTQTVLSHDFWYKNILKGLCRLIRLIIAYQNVGLMGILSTVWQKYSQVGKGNKLFYIKLLPVAPEYGVMCGLHYYGCV
jgi:hypothetical protein